MSWIRIILGVTAIFVSAVFVACFAVRVPFFGETRDSDYSFFTPEKSEIERDEHRENARIVRPKYICGFM